MSLSDKGFGSTERSPCAIGVGHLGGDAQVPRHAVQGVDEVLDFVVAACCDVLAEIAMSDRVCEGDGAPEAAADAERQEEAGDDADQDRGGGGSDKPMPGVVVLIGRILLGLLQQPILDAVDFLQLAHDLLSHVLRVVRRHDPRFRLAVLIHKLALLILQARPSHPGRRDGHKILPDGIGRDVLHGLEFLQENVTAFCQLSRYTADLFRRCGHNHVFFSRGDIHDGQPQVVCALQADNWSIQEFQQGRIERSQA